MEISEIETYVIGVPAKYRGLHLETQLSDNGITFTRIDGIDGSTSPEENFFHLVDTDITQILLNRTLSKGEICCALAHNQAYKEFSKSKKEWALILEDDANLGKNFIENLQKVKIRERTPIIIQLYGVNLYSQIINRWPANVKKIKDLSATDDLIRLEKKWDIPPLTHGYLINKRASTRAYEELEQSKILTPADWPIQWRQKIRFYISSEELIGLGESVSLIQSERVLLSNISEEEIPSPIYRIIWRVLSGKTHHLQMLINKKSRPLMPIILLEDYYLFKRRLQINLIFVGFNKFFSLFKKVV